MNTPERPGTYGVMHRQFASKSLAFVLSHLPLKVSARFGKGGTMTQSPMEDMKEVARAGYCRHPIRIYGETFDLATGEIKPSDLRIPCKDRRAAICPSCAYLYKADAWILASTGLIGGKSLPESVATHPRIFVTLTALSFGEVHTVNDSRACHPRPRRCVHGVRPCRRRHGDEAAELGSPLCKACFDYEGAVLWNAFASKLWNRTRDRLRHRLATSQGLSEASFLCVHPLGARDRLARPNRRDVVTAQGGRSSTWRERQAQLDSTTIQGYPS